MGLAYEKSICLFFARTVIHEGHLNIIREAKNMEN